MRIDTDLTEGDRQRVKEWANKQGLKMQRAYTILIRKGLKCEKDGEQEV